MDTLRSRGFQSHVGGDDPIEAGQIRVGVIEDDHLADGFTWGRHGPLPADLVEQVANCRRAALIEMCFRLDQAPARVAELGRALRSAGGVAVRMEASGSAWPWEPWLEHLDSGLPSAIYSTAVLIARGSDGAVFTCGMHHFDLPDAQITMDDPAAAIAWLDTFNVYQLAESPVLASGHTFQPDPASDRRALERWPDHRHHPDDGRHNPFGIWRFLAPGEKRLEVAELVSVIMPSLVAMLVAAERKNGRPLTRAEVEWLVGESPAITMERRDAIALEQSRGYADIEPELAWEQWQIVRATM
ncbi:MAG: hypothetical protein ABMA64_06050 [Myxococcota bacterium]